MNILLVDDHPENLLALEAVLDAPEYRLVRALSGMEALRLLLQEEFSLILLDVCMPGLNGFETANLIRERPKSRNIPIIFITAVNKGEDDTAKGYAAGALDYITKPFNPDALKTKVAVLAGLFKRDVIPQQDGTVLVQERRRLPGGAEADPLTPEEQDINQRRYRNLANAIPQIVWIARPNGAISFFSHPWFGYTGLTFEGSEGTGWTQAVHPNDRPAVLEGWAEAVAQERDFNKECRLKRADGAYRWHLIRALPERDHQRRILAWLGTATDVNDQKQAQERLHQVIEALEQKKIDAETATRLKSEFVSYVSHELRTPVNAIIGYGALLSEGNYGPIVEEQKIPFDGIKRNAAELRELIDNLLDLSKIEAGKMPASLEPVDLKRLLTATFENVKPMINGKKIEVVWKIQEDLKIIQSDPLKIRQIFLNLISNAIKFTEQGTMTISARNAEEGIRLSVQDTGIGIEEENLAIIFDAFRQIEGPPAQEMGGSGLGLTIVRNTVESLCGKIEVRSVFGKGSTFTVYFPESLSASLKPEASHSKSLSLNSGPTFTAGSEK